MLGYPLLQRGYEKPAKGRGFTMPVVELPAAGRALSDVGTFQRFIFRDADWALYQRVLKALDCRPIRLTYDRGRLELMTLSHRHDRSSSILALFVVILTEELDMPRQSGRSTTFSREDLDRGIEADDCFYLEHEALVRHKDELDLDVDPPPDLAIEVEVSRSALDRMAIYAALKVPEVWRYDGEKIYVHVLRLDGQYQIVERSPHFPFLPMQEVEAFLKRRTEMDETRLGKLFRQWVREQMAKDWK
jgi:Uma2 family endonuclease